MLFIGYLHNAVQDRFYLCGCWCTVELGIHRGGRYASFLLNIGLESIVKHHTKRHMEYEQPKCRVWDVGGL